MQNQTQKWFKMSRSNDEHDPLKAHNWFFVPHAALFYAKCIYFPLTTMTPLKNGNPPYTRDSVINPTPWVLSQASTANSLITIYDQWISLDLVAQRNIPSRRSIMGQWWRFPASGVRCRIRSFRAQQDQSLSIGQFTVLTCSLITAFMTTGQTVTCCRMPFLN